jgi:hypothetical protein
LDLLRWGAHLSKIIIERFRLGEDTWTDCRVRSVPMADPNDESSDDEATKPSIRKTAAKKTRAAKSATADVMRDAFDKVIESIDDAATRQQHKATVKEEKAVAKQERKAEQKAHKAATKPERTAADHQRHDEKPPANS